MHCRNNLQKLPTYQIGWKWYPILGSNKNSQQNVGHEVPYSKSAYLQQDLWYWSTWLDSNLFLNILPLAVLPLCGSLCFRCLFGYLVASCWQGHMKLWTERNYSLVAQDVWKTCRSIGSSNLCQDSHRSQNTSSNGPFSLLCSFTKVYETYVLRSPPPSSSLFLLQFLSIHVFPGFPIGQWQKSITFCVIEVTLFPWACLGGFPVTANCLIRKWHGHTFSILLFGIYQTAGGFEQLVLAEWRIPQQLARVQSLQLFRVTHFKQMRFLKVSENVSHRWHV